MLGGIADSGRSDISKPNLTKVLNDIFSENFESAFFKNSLNSSLVPFEAIFIFK